MKDSRDAGTTKNQELGTKNSRRPAAGGSLFFNFNSQLQLAANGGILRNGDRKNDRN